MGSVYIAPVLMAAALIGHGHTVTVQAGDTLSEIAQANCGTSADYPGLAAASRITNPDLIFPGQAITLNCKPGAAATTLAADPLRHVKHLRHAAHQAHLAGMAEDAQAQVQTATVTYTPKHAAAGYTGTHRSTRHVSSAPATYTPSGGMESCIVAAESGGNARAVNPSSGAGGLYQFLPSTWAALGHSGLPENASVAEQTQAFHQEVAQDGGYSAWTPYDSC